MKTIKLVHGNVYGHVTDLFYRGEEYEVSDELANILLKEGYTHYDADLRQTLSFNYFEEVVKEKPAKTAKSTKEEETKV